MATLNGAMGKCGTGLRLTISAAGAMLAFESAVAADMPVKALAPVPAFIDWSGVYIGVHAGYGGGMNDHDIFGAVAPHFVSRGFLGGGQIGINKQIASFVFGLELDGSWADIRGSQNLSIGGASIGIQQNFAMNSKVDGLVTLAGRAGLAADRWFVFAKAGVAVAHEDHSFAISISQIPGNSASATAGGTETRVLPMLGFGAEYALGGNWSLKGEYDYFHSGSRNVRFPGTQTAAGVTASFVAEAPVEQALHVIKIGANYRLGGFAVDPAYAPVRAASGHNWTGAYIGVQGGYGFGRNEWPDVADPLNSAAGKYDVDGWLAGGTGGVNVQSGVFVFGVEGEWLWTGIKGGQTLAFASGGTSQTTTLDTRIDWLAIASARAGFVVGDKLLLYGKGGVAIAQEQHSFGTTQIIAGAGSATFAANAKAVHTGVVVGAGAEYALGGNWSARIEYDYIRMAGQGFTATGSGTINAPPQVGTFDFAQSFNKMPQDLQLIKFGVNYHFNSMPVVARY